MKCIGTVIGTAVAVEEKVHLMKLINVEFDGVDFEPLDIEMGRYRNPFSYEESDEDPLLEAAERGEVY